MSDATAEPTTPATQTSAPSVAEETAPATSNPQDTTEAPAPEGGGDSTETPATEAAPDEAKERRTLADERARIARQNRRLEERRKELKAEREQMAQTLELAKVLDTDDELALLDAYAKRKGLDRVKVFDRITSRLVNPEAVPLDKQVEAALEARIAREKAAEDARVKSEGERFAVAQQKNEAAFAQQAGAYIRTELLEERFPFLADYGPQEVARIAVSEVVQRTRKTGKPENLDKVLEEWNDLEHKRLTKAATRLNPGEKQVQANTERAGAVEPAKPEPRKGKTLSNAHAATRASPDSEEDVTKLSDAELNRRAAEAVRRADPRWR